MADPIIFSAAMVNALLAGRKTQTRRLMPHQETLKVAYSPIVSGIRIFNYAGEEEISRPPVKVGDRLYVREHWRTADAYDDLSPSQMGGEEPVIYLADDTLETWGWRNDFVPGRFRQAMHMPRWASRLTLTVTDVRVQRLQDISEADAWAEGCKPGELNDRGEPFPAEEPHPKCGWVGWDCARDWYADLWNSLHGPDAWEANPWVAAYSFAVQHGNIDTQGDPQ